MIVKVYTRPECHLCEEAVSGLEGLRAEIPGMELTEIDIDSDDDLLCRYLERIPVIEAGGEVIAEIFFEEERVRAALTDLDTETPGSRGQVR